METIFQFQHHPQMMSFVDQTFVQMTDGEKPDHILYDKKKQRFKSRRSALHMLQKMVKFITKQEHKLIPALNELTFFIEDKCFTMNELNEQFDFNPKDLYECPTKRDELIFEFLYLFVKEPVKHLTAKKSLPKNVFFF